ncbi:Uncharacterised protein [Mycobacterium tuberculosis]|uniref:Uncharacterized protein n=1 Tax=Mycobacterium tuberculosis TaxID=1773 RepID=A0A654TYU2_MYCTX|nr:Uncharacterised protein [Mycobacterium tuberculosis]COY11931.1 Uncharacterised protein [Mycobacterium tuberculosis]CPA28703.1 Uncharacterised protein [Mycobacterium tuberculosis]
MTLIHATYGEAAATIRPADEPIHDPTVRPQTTD